MAVSIDLKDFRVRSLDRDLFEVSWKVLETAEDVLDYTFEVLRSESPSGPFEPLAPAFRDRYLFIDNNIPTGNRWRMLHYIIRVRHVPTDCVKDFGPVSHEPDPDLIALELRRHMQLLFHEYAGRRCWVLPVRTFGSRCECYSVSLAKRTRSGCRMCFDTGFTRGYLSPIEVWIQIDPSPKANQATNVGAQQQVNTTARVGYYPPLKPMDLIVEGENRRWKVVTVAQTEQGRAPVHQEIQLHEVPPRDIEFAVPLEMKDALKDIFFNPPRNYSNPQNLDSFLDNEFDAIQKLYRQVPR